MVTCVYHLSPRPPAWGRCYNGGGRPRRVQFMEGLDVGDTNLTTISGNAEPHRCSCKHIVIYRPCLICHVRRWLRARKAGQPLPELPEYLQGPGGSRRRGPHGLP